MWCPCSATAGAGIGGPNRGVVRPDQLAPRPDGRAFQVQQSDLRQQDPAVAVPLETELHVGPGGVAVVDWVVADVIVVLQHLRAVEKLEGADRRVPVNRADQPGHHRVLGMEPVAHLVRVVIPAARVPLECLPFLPADDPLPVRAVNAPLVEVCPFEHPAELPRQYDVGVQVQDPVLAADLVEAAIDQPGLVERAAAAVVLGEDVVDVVPAADRAGFLVVWRGDHDKVIN